MMRTIQNRTILNKKNIICNSCGKKIELLHGRPDEGVFFGKQNWGYFSKKDGETHSFYLCEECYDKITEKFAVAVKIREEKELI